MDIRLLALGVVLLPALCYAHGGKKGGAPEISTCNAAILGITQEFSGVYKKRKGGPVQNGTFVYFNGRRADQACWRNAPSSEDRLQYVVIPEGTRLDQCKAPKDGLLTPHGQSVGIVTPKGAKGAGILQSCSVICTDGPPEITIKGACTEGVKLQVCLAHSFKFPAHHNLICCQDVPMNQPIKVCDELKRPTIYDLLVVARGFGENDYVAFNEIIVNAPSCFDDSQICEEAGCTFDKNMCNYKKPRGGGAGGGGGGEFKPYPAKTVVGNLDSGTNAAGFGNNGARPPVVATTGFTAVALNPGDKSAVCSGVTKVRATNIEMRFMYYDACDKNSAKVCFDGVKNCVFTSNVGVSAGDRRWKQGKAAVPKGTTTICLMADDSGDRFCSVGFDEITFYKDGKEICEQIPLEGK